MHDARTVDLANPQEFRIARNQSVHERAIGLPGPRMHHKAGRFIDHDHVVVFVDDRELDIDLGRRGGIVGRREFDRDDHSGVNLAARRRDWSAVDNDLAPDDQFLRKRAADPRNRRHDAVDPLAVEGFWKRLDQVLVVHGGLVGPSRLRDGCRVRQPCTRRALRPTGSHGGALEGSTSLRRHRCRTYRP